MAILHVIRTVEEVDAACNICSASSDSGVSSLPGMTYEEGFAAAIEWLTDDGISIEDVL